MKEKINLFLLVFFSRGFDLCFLGNVTIEELGKFGEYFYIINKKSFSIYCDQFGINYELFDRKKLKK